MMGEIVVQRHAAHAPAYLHASLDVAKTAQRTDRLARFHTGMARRRDRREGVHAIVIAQQIPVDATVGRAGESDLEGPVWRGVARVPTGLVAKELDFAPATACKHPRKAGFTGVDDKPAGAWHSSHQMMKLRLDGGKIAEDIGVIELKVIENRGARPVVDKFAALIEKSRVVLVCFDHKTCVRHTRARRNTEILRNAADQKTRFQSCRIENPRQHRRSGGLSVRARYRQHVAPREQMFAHPLRP